MSDRQSPPDEVSLAEVRTRVLGLTKHSIDVNVLVRHSLWLKVEEQAGRARKQLSNGHGKGNNFEQTLGRLLKAIEKAGSSRQYVDGDVFDRAIALGTADVQKRLNDEWARARRSQRQAESELARKESSEQAEKDREDRLETKHRSYKSYLAGYADITTDPITSVEQHLGYAIGVHDRKQQQKPKSFTELTTKAAEMMQ